METTQSPEPTRQKQALRSRLFWFVAGSGVNYLLISTPLKWLAAHTALPGLAVAGLSMGTGSLFFFCWNYFVNFRTDTRKRDALWRYVVAVAFMWALSSTVLALLKGYNAQMHFTVLTVPLDLDVVATQFFLAGIKFPIYHKWAFPVQSTRALTEPEPAEPRVQAS